MEHLFVAALLIPRSQPKEGALPALLGKTPPGFGSVLEALSASPVLTLNASTPSEEPLLSPDHRPVVPQGEQEVPAPVEDATGEEQTPEVQTSQEAALIPVMLLPVVAQPALAPPVEAALPPAQSPGAVPAQTAVLPEAQPMAAAALPALERTPQVQLPATRHAEQAPTEPVRPEVTSRLPLRADPAATAKGIDLALLEEAGMDILRATGEAELKALARPASNVRQPAQQGQPEMKAPDESQPTRAQQAVRTDEAVAAAGLQPAKRAGRSGPSAVTARADAPERAEGARPAEVFRETLRDALPTLVETSRIQSARSTPLREPPAEAERTDVPNVERVAVQASKEPAKQPPVREAARSAAQRASEDVRGGAEPSTAVARATQHDATRTLGVSRGESRGTEVARTLVDQVVKALQLEIRGPVSEMRLRLEPESLGELALRVRVDEGRLQARIEVTQPAVKAIIEGNLPQLRQSLSAQGIQVERIDITTQDRSLGRGNSDGNTGRERRRGSRPEEVLGAEPVGQAARMLGYNTIELTM